MIRTFGFLLVLLSSGMLLLPNSLPAQAAAKWLFHIKGGPSLYRGDVSKETLGTLEGKSLSWGAGVHYRLTDHFLLGASAHQGELRGADANYTFDPYRLERDFEFYTAYWDAAIDIRYLPWIDNPLQPYAGLGIGGVFFDPDASLLGNTHLDLADFIKQDIDSPVETPAIIVPLSLGLSYRFSSLLASQLDFTYKLTDTDFLDGISFSGNPNDQDHYGHLTLGLVLQLGLHQADIDEDGIPDEEDECPYKPGSSRTGGCPDSDNDGLRDSDDQCPLAAGIIDLYGCPDTDQDGTADPYDRCPALAGPPESLGCPPKDTDFDGTQDHLDDCPLEPGPPARRGCPAIDTDQDGLLDEDDHCPQHYGPLLFDGCPDSDGDGIEDIKDACPSSFGSFDEKGCPSVASPAQEAELLNAQRLYFGARNADLANFMLLDKLAGFLRNHPSYRVLIIGHADGYGSEEAFNYLSQLRAERVKRYLLDSNVPEDQLLMRAAGARMPLQAAATPTAQMMNRRVEFLVELR
jgi:hypothetical protein